ncbi:helix-turn-helix domain containing protein [Bradyrhizobium sp. CER78]|uniref:TetR/AcrR family transcriptional regulator n=1 Tax=Bradyrhizobium sp. CER78 TaxID=3039162 RepID=UPI00244A2A30|nr:helix-turn-helix domain containing protein [Bradyrhizobium sp. CER78]MDH2381829.1 helix-turn-helix domain containing protein [Bradyrhizobium sp. CER78]
MLTAERARYDQFELEARTRELHGVPGDQVIALKDRRMSPRAYRQSARADAVQDTERQIVDALRALLEERWFDEITLDDIAAAAGTTRQTVIRRFGSKTGVLSAMAAQMDVSIQAQRWSTPAQSVADIVRLLTDDYERTGDIIVRTLSQEARIPEFAAILDRGRKAHRKWIEDVFGAWLDKLDGQARGDRLAQLLVQTDVWIWHLLRRAQGHSAAKTHRLMTQAIERLLREGRAN